MKQYSVYFREAVPYTYMNNVWNKELKRWEEREITQMKDTFTFFTLTAAKKLIKANLDKYEGSSITKIWSNGSWENLGPINLKGNNKTMVVNTRQKKANY